MIRPLLKFLAAIFTGIAAGSMLSAATGITLCLGHIFLALCIAAAVWITVKVKQTRI